MPFQPINYANAPLVDSAFGNLDFGEMLRKGMQLRHEPQRLLRQQEQEKLANALGKEKVAQAQATTPFVPRQLEADIKQKELMSKLPYGGQIPGDVGQALYTHFLEQIGHPAGADARRARETLFGGRELNMALGPKKAGTTNYKLELENEEIRNNPDLSEQEKKDRIGSNNAAISKNSRIAVLEEQKTRADITSEGFEKLLQPDMLDALTTYSGPDGFFKKRSDDWEKYTTGITPPRMLLHDEAQATAEATAMNLRAAIKESVSPQKGKQILDIISPASLSVSKEQAKRRIQAAADFFEDIEKKALYKSTGREEEYKKEKNMKELGRQSKEAKANNVKSEQGTNESAYQINWVWNNGKWVKK